MKPPQYLRSEVRTDLNPVRILTFRIDDRDVTAREDETILTVARQKRHQYTHPVSSGRSVRARRLPAVYSRNQGLAQTPSFMCDPAAAGHGDNHQFRKGCGLSKEDPRTHVYGTEPRLFRMCGQRSL